jgi:hypothetical protein
VPDHLDRLARLVKAGYGEVELHLHHDSDDEKSLRNAIEHGLERFARHGHLSRDDAGHVRYGFIHGNWCLANARKDGRHCGVDRELPLLFDTGCYADYTFPSAPDECQPAIINQIYWPVGELGRRRAYEQGRRAAVGTIYNDRILMMEGPLALARRPGRLAIRIESAAITAADPATSVRLRTWTAQNIHVGGRPEWVFVKVHTHGAPDAEADALLGEGGHGLHRTLAQEYNDGRNWCLHYVTAREMFNIAMAAMVGKRGNPGDYRDFVLKPPPAVSP